MCGGCAGVNESERMTETCVVWWRGVKGLG